MVSHAEITLHGVSEGPRVGWENAQAWPLWAAGLVGVVASVIWALRRPADA